MPWYVVLLRSLTEFIAPTQFVKTVKKGEEEKVKPVNKFNATTIVTGKGDWEKVFYIRGKPFAGAINYFVNYTEEGKTWREFWERFKQNLECIAGAFFKPECVAQGKEFYVKPGKSFEADVLKEGSLVTLFLKTREPLDERDLEQLKTLMTLAYTEVGVGKRKKYGFGKFVVVDVKEGYNPWIGPQ